MSWSVSLLLLSLSVGLWLAGSATGDDVFGLLAKIIGTVFGLVVILFGHQLPLELCGLLLALSLPAARSFQGRPGGVHGRGARRPSRWTVFAD